MERTINLPVGPRNRRPIFLGSALRKLLAFARKEAVLSLSFVCAVASSAFVPVDKEYIGYIDLRVLCLLFCLMAVVAGFQQCGLFSVMAQRLLSGKKHLRILYLVLVMLPFFCSMLVTNDVALITFVPFAVLVLKRIGKESALTRIVILQTLAANLGSMATPIGNPQNLFLCSYYSLGMGDFLRVVAPLTAVSLVLLGVVAASARKETIEIEFSEAEKVRQPKLFALLCALFLMCLLSVVHILHYGILTAVVFVCLVLFARGLFKKVDYALLATFVCFFVFAGNIGRIEPIRNVLELLMERSAYWTSLLASQVISNVPAAVLLSGFTDNWSGIIAGVDVGGLGTPIASLASLISLKFYLRAETASLPRYLLIFTLMNIAGIVLLSGAAAVFALI